MSLTTTDELPEATTEIDLDEAPAEQPAAAPAAIAAPAAPAEADGLNVGSDDRDAHENKLKRQQRILHAQPKEKIRIPKAMGPQTVIINGARFNIPAGVIVEVPQQVAELMRDAEWF